MKPLLPRLQLFYKYFFFGEEPMVSKEHILDFATSFYNYILVNKNICN
jgi:hypothetical protein